MQHGVSACRRDGCVQCTEKQQEFVQLCPILTLLRAGGEAVSLALVAAFLLP